MIDQRHGWNISFKPPLLGFVFSLLLTVAAYQLATQYEVTSTIAFVIFGLCVVQGLLQLIFFMFLGLSTKPHWNLITFLFMVLIVIIIVGGSIWIMNNLNYNMMH